MRELCVIGILHLFDLVQADYLQGWQSVQCKEQRAEHGALWDSALRAEVCQLYLSDLN